MEKLTRTLVRRAALGQQVEVAQDQRRLGEDRERVGALGQHLDDAPGEAVLALGPLVRVGVGAHGDVVAPPPLRRRARRAAARRALTLTTMRLLEVAAGVEVEVLVRRPSEAVVADHPVGDEVAGPGGDVVHRDVDARAARWRRPRAGIALDGHAVDGALAGDRRVHREEEPQVPAQPADAAGRTATPFGRRRSSSDVAEPEPIEAAAASSRMISSIGVADAEDAPAVRCPRRRRSRPGTPAPVDRWIVRPRDEPPDRLDAGRRLRADRRDRRAASPTRREGELRRRDA